MSSAARKIVAAELMHWLEREQSAVVLTTSALEDQTRIKEWGKWALLGESARLGIKPQLRFRPRNREELGAWGGIELMADDEAMRIDAAIACLGATDKKIIQGLYMYWWSTRYAAEKLCLPRCQVLDRRDKALAFIAGKVTYESC
jgi:hypothetical protein